MIPHLEPLHNRLYVIEDRDFVFVDGSSDLVSQFFSDKVAERIRCESQRTGLKIVERVISAISFVITAYITLHERQTRENNSASSS